MSSYSNTQPPSNARYILSALLALGIIGVVGLVILFLYFTNRPVPLSVGPAEERKAKLADVNAKQNEIISTYSWVDQPSGVVRIPVERAMKLIVEKLEKSKEKTPQNTKESVSKS